MPDAVVFDLDGVLVDSEERWERARCAVADSAGRPYPDDATRVMQGMSAPEWTAYLHDELGVPDTPAEIGARVVAEMAAGYREALPLLPGAAEAVAALAERWPLAVASSANREIIELVLDLVGLRERFAAVVSSEEVACGKPVPDVYLEAAARLGVDPTGCVAIETPAFPLAADALALADVTVDRVGAVTPELVAALPAR